VQDGVTLHWATATVQQGWSLTAPQPVIIMEYSLACIVWQWSNVVACLPLLCENWLLALHKL
jgi:hypothetical protein